MRSVPLGLILAAAVLAPQALAKAKNTFGRDDRVDLDPATGAFTAILRLDGGCSAVLVAPRLALTAAHCLFDEAGAARPPAFVARGGFRAGQASTSVNVERAWLGTKTPNDQRTRDWAILQLDDAPDGLGTGLVVDSEALTGATTLPYTVSLAGYSADRRGGTVLSLHRDCLVRTVDREGQRFFHDCDSKSGISGAPLLVKIGEITAIVGLSVSEFRQGAPESVERGEYSDDYANVGIAASTFAAPLRALIDSVGAGQPAPEIEGVTLLENPRGTRPEPGRLEDYAWTEVETFSGSMPHGANAFDYAFAEDVAFNRLKLEFRPAACANVRNVTVAAVTEPEANEWEDARMFDGLGAAFARGGFRFLRFTWHNDGFVQNRCELVVSGADGPDGPTTGRGPDDSVRNWYCAAGLEGDLRDNYYYWWLHPSVDFARYQALSYCTQRYGYACLVSCRPYD